MGRPSPARCRTRCRRSWRQSGRKTCRVGRAWSAMPRPCRSGPRPRHRSRRAGAPLCCRARLPQPSGPVWLLAAGCCGTAVHAISSGLAVCAGCCGLAAACPAPGSVQRCWLWPNRARASDVGQQFTFGNVPNRAYGIESQLTDQFREKFREKLCTHHSSVHQPCASS